MEPLTPKKKGSGLGSLAQRARGQHLTRASRILGTVGALNLVFGIAAFLVARPVAEVLVGDEVQKQRLGRVDPVQLQQWEDEMTGRLQLGGGLSVGIGLLFIAFAMLLRKHPVPITVTSLVIYIALFAIGLVSGGFNLIAFVIQVAIIAALAKAVQAAIAYQKEQKQLEEAEPTYEPEPL